MEDCQKHKLVYSQICLRCRRNVCSLHLVFIPGVDKVQLQGISVVLSNWDLVHAFSFYMVTVHIINVLSFTIS